MTVITQRKGSSWPELLSPTCQQSACSVFLLSSSLLPLFGWVFRLSARRSMQVLGKRIS